MCNKRTHYWSRTAFLCSVTRIKGSTTPEQVVLGRSERQCASSVFVAYRRWVDSIRFGSSNHRIRIEPINLEPRVLFSSSPIQLDPPRVLFATRIRAGPDSPAEPRIDSRFRFDPQFTNSSPNLRYATKASSPSPKPRLPPTYL